MGSRLMRYLYKSSRSIFSIENDNPFYYFQLLARQIWDYRNISTRFDVNFSQPRLDVLLPITLKLAIDLRVDWAKLPSLKWRVYQRLVK